jgi:hypothetical protein
MLRISGRRRRLAIRLGSLAVLLLAVMPQVLYLGHPLSGEEAPAPASATGHEHHDKVAAEHANHCHVGPKGCAAADGAVNTAPLANVAWVLPAIGGFYTLEEHQSLQSFTLWQRPEKPPQPA